MSIVGTRPPLIGEVSEYELHHRARLAIKPGITGMWQVSGRSDITDFEEVVEVLLINKFLFRNGGSETYIFKLGEALEQHGHEVQYFGMV